MTQDTYVQSPVGGHNGLDVNIISGEPIPVFIVNPEPPPTPQAVSLVYNGITSVPSSTLSTILTYVVPVGKTFYVSRAEVSGTNIAQYSIVINGSTVGVRRTYFGSDLDTEFEFSTIPETGPKLNQGDTILVKVEHFRPDLGDFDATLVGLLVG